MISFQRVQKRDLVMLIYEEIIFDHVIGDGKQKKGEVKGLLELLAFWTHMSGSSKTNGIWVLTACYTFSTKVRGQ